MGTPILVVDDDEVLGRILSRILKGYGYSVLQASDPDQALRLAQQHHPQLALVDLCMPGTDGVELARQLRTQLGELPVILMTAYPLRLAEHPELADHFARVLLKPLDLAALREAIQAALPGTANGVGVTKRS